VFVYEAPDGSQIRFPHQPDVVLLGNVEMANDPSKRQTRVNVGTTPGEDGPEGKGYRVHATSENSYDTGTPALDPQERVYLVDLDYAARAAYTPGARFRASLESEATYYDEGTVVSYDPDTRLLVGLMTYGRLGRSGTTWWINLAGDPAAYYPGQVQYTPGRATLLLETGQEFYVDLNQGGLGAGAAVVLDLSGPIPPLRSLQIYVQQPSPGGYLRTLSYEPGKFRASYAAVGGVPPLTQAFEAVDTMTGYFWPVDNGKLTLYFGPNVQDI
jgi:hypothetical protein